MDIPGTDAKLSHTTSVDRRWTDITAHIPATEIRKLSAEALMDLVADIKAALSLNLAGQAHTGGPWARSKMLQERCAELLEERRALAARVQELEAQLGYERKAFGDFCLRNQVQAEAL